MELWDLYDGDRRLTGETMVRGESAPAGRYHLVVDAFFLNSKGETLLQQRADEKDIMPSLWSLTGGSATAGEDSAAAIVRETEEEMGFTPDLSRGRVLMSEKQERRLAGYFRDVWLFVQDVPIESMRWQAGEVQDGMWILPEKIAADPALWDQLNQLHFFSQAYPYLMLESMRLRIPVGVYRHYKGNRYAVEGLSLHSETLEPMVNYRALYGMGERWVRPASMWHEIVTLPDGSQTPRFSLEEAETRRD